MTPESLDKAIQFILEQQAAFDLALEKTRKQMNESFEQTQAQLRETGAYVREIGKKTESNTEQIRLLAEQVRVLKDACRDLLEHSGYTDYRLNRLENPER